MSYLIINDTDVSNLVSGLKVGYETLVSEDSGRNAAGDTVVDIINRKVKLYVTFRPMDGSEMSSLLSAIADYVVNVSYLDSKTNSIQTVQCYHGTPEPEYYWILGSNVLYKQFSFNFIEM
jgi:5'-3' exonuclease